jgi:phosphotransferase system enzyme I (PtsI)
LKKGGNRVIIKGLAVSPGIAIAESYVFQAKEKEKEERIVKINQKDLDNELHRLQQAVVASKKQLQSLSDKARNEIGKEQAEIMEAHMAFLDDPAFVGEMENLVSRECFQAESAVRQVTTDFVHIFENLEDPYMRERAADVRDVGNQLLRGLRGQPMSDVSSISQPVILIARDLAPSETIQLPKQYVKGILLTEGGPTSHTAILAKALGIPAVVGVGDTLFEHVHNRDILIVDGTSGEIHIRPDDVTRNRYIEEMERERRHQDQLDKMVLLPAESLDGHRVEISGNIGGVAEVDLVLENGAEGVGLFRSEFLFMDRESLPSEEEQFAAYAEVARKMKGKPVIIRTLDIGGDKQLEYLDLPKEMNPFLGWRAIRIGLSQPDLFKTQVRAILRAGSHGKVLMMFPMISHLEQVRKAKQLVEEAKQELRSQRVAFDEQLQIGVMIEIPSACLIADSLAKEVDFFSIGTNDLVQYTLAVDRMNDKVSPLYTHFHPAVLRLIKWVIDASHANRIWTGMCGEMAGDPVATELLLGLGLDEFSASARSLPQLKHRIRSLTHENAKQTADKALSLPTAEEVREFLQSRM